MLTLFRNLLRSKFALLLIGLLMIAMAAWGVTDIFTPRVGDNLGRTGDRVISVNSFDREIERFLQRMAAQQTDPDADRPTKLALAEEGQIPLYFDVVLRRQALLAYAADQGLSAAESSARTIMTENRQAVQANIRQSQGRETAATILEDIQGQLTNSYLGLGTIAALQPPSAFAELFFAHRDEVRRVAYFVIDEDDLDPIPEPTDEDLETFFQTNLPTYEEPEYRTVSVLHVTFEDFRHLTPVTEADIRDEYERNIRVYSAPQRERDIAQLVFDDRAAALQASGLLGAGLTPQEVADQTGALSVAVTKLVREDLSDNTYRDDLFSSMEGTVAGPIEQNGLWTVGRVEAIIPGAPLPFEAVSDDIERELQLAGADARFTQVLDEIDDARGAGSSLEEIGQSVGVPVLTLPAVNQGGRTRDGGFGLLPVSIVREDEGGERFDADAFREALELTFSLFEGETTQRVLLPDQTFYYLRVDKVDAPRTPELDELRDELRLAWRQTKREEAYDTLAADIEARLEAGTAFIDQEAATLGAEVVRIPEGVDRNILPGEVFPPQAVSELFATKPGEAFVSELNNGRVIALVESLERPDRARLATLAATDRAGDRASAIESDLEFALQQAILSSVEIEENRPLLEAYERQLRGE